MLPTNLVALAVLAASITPGYVLVRVSENRVPRADRTQLLELAELIVVGAFASSLSFLVVLSLAKWWDLIDVEALAKDGTSYVIENPGRALGAFAVGLGLACAGTWAAALVAYRGDPPTIQHGTSAWYKVLRTPEGRMVYATVDLRDGSTIAGWVLGSTVEPFSPDRRELVLARTRLGPIKIRAVDSDQVVTSPDRVLVINGADVLTLGVRHVPFEPRRSDED